MAPLFKNIILNQSLSYRKCQIHLYRHARLRGGPRSSLRLPSGPVRPLCHRDSRLFVLRNARLPTVGVLLLYIFFFKRRIFKTKYVINIIRHERKKMYWEQLELRSRALFRRQHTHPPIPCCGCCQDCRLFAPASSSISGSSGAINNPMLAWPPWDVLDDR